MSKKTTRPVFPFENPEILTERLLLRPLLEADYPEFRQLRHDPEIAKWTSLKKLDPDEAVTRDRFQRFSSPNEGRLFGYGFFEKDAPERLVGAGGCHRTQPSHECGYVLFPQYWGRGYATEAMRAWLEAYWRLEREEEEEEEAEQERGDRREVLKAMTYENNIGSQGVLRKCGFVETKRYMGEGEAIRTIEYELIRPTQRKQ